jgi:hypothetical protein
VKAVTDISNMQLRLSAVVRAFEHATHLTLSRTGLIQDELQVKRPIYMTACGYKPMKK